jgi:hypothetical protein
MRNNLGLRALFGDNMKSIKLFLDWCENNDELCEYDLEHIKLSLALGAINNVEMFFHFHTGNILDFLESRGYYIGLPLRGNFKYVTCCYQVKEYPTVGRPFYNNSGIVGRTRALEIGVKKCIEHLESNLE